MELTNVEDIYPLSPMQQGMLFHSIYAADSSVYFTQLSGWLEGTSDAQTFRGALQRAVERHPVLRTAFLWEGLDEPLQVVRRDVQLRCEELDWRDVAASEQSGCFEALLSGDRRRGFDPGEAPLMRLTLVRTDDSRYRFVWSSHHILLDGWSMSLLVREVLEDCDATRQGRAPNFEPRRPYRDYIAWLKRQDRAASESFWKNALEGFTEPSLIAAGRSADAKGRDCGLRGIALSAETSSRLAAMARQHQVTLNTSVQAAWAVVLSRYSGAADVLFGAVVSGRPAGLLGVESTIGLFINALPVRERISRGKSVGAWMKEMQERQLAARQYEYASLVDIQGASDVPRGVPLFDSIVVFENYPAMSAAGEIAFFEKANYPVTVIARPGEQLSLSVNFDPHVIDDEFAGRLLDAMETVLEQMALDPEQPVGDLRLMKPAELTRVTREWNDTNAPYPAHLCVHEVFERQAAARPEQAAVRYGADSLTYGELNRRANRLARHLQACGAGAGQLVAMCLERSPEMIVATLAILKAGAAYVPLDAGYPRERLEFMLADTKAAVLLTARHLMDRLPPFAGRIVCLDEDLPLAEGNLNVKVDPEELAYVMYTSGSTGQPKGIGIPHRAVNRLVLNSNYVRLEADDRVAQNSNICFDAATFEIWGALMTGATLVGISKEVALSPRDFAAQLRDEGITTLFLTTALFNRMAAEAPGAFAGLRHLLFGGEAVDPACVRKVLSDGAPGRLLHVYGPTESTTFATWFEIAAVAASATTVPIGQPLANTRIYVVDDAMEPVPPGVAGELLIGGDGLARGYAGRPELTGEKFIPDAFGDGEGARLYRTGDVVRWNTDGAIEFVGRNDNQVKIRGFRIEPGEVEAVLRGHPLVRECTVMPREDTPGERRLVAYIAAEAGELNEVRNYARERLPEYMVPGAWVAMPELPLNANGKVDRKALPAPDCGRPELESSYVAPRNALESVVAGICGEVLRVDRVGVDDSFFELGAHSLLATQLVSRLRESFQIDLPLRTIFECPTVGQLCEAMTADPAGRERVEATAELILSVAGLSESEVESLLTSK